MRTITNKPITAQQLKALHATFRTLRMDADARHGCIYSFTNGRTQSSKELTMEEARQLLEKLNPMDDKARQLQHREAQMVFRDIYRLSFLIPQLNQGFSSDNEEEYQMNVAKLNVWARKYTKARKDVTEWHFGNFKRRKSSWRHL